MKTRIIQITCSFADNEGKQVTWAATFTEKIKECKYGKKNEK